MFLQLALGGVGMRAAAGAGDLKRNFGISSEEKFIFERNFDEKNLILDGILTFCFENRDLKTLIQNLKSGSENPF